MVSVLTIGVVWLNHHRIFTQVHRVDGPLLVLNLNMLLWTALIPFPTAVVAEHLAESGEPAQTAAARPRSHARGRTRPSPDAGPAPDRPHRARATGAKPPAS